MDAIQLFFSSLEHTQGAAMGELLGASMALREDALGKGHPSEVPFIFSQALHALGAV